MPQHKYVALIYDREQGHYVWYFDTEESFSTYLSGRRGSWGALYDMGGSHIVTMSIPATPLCSTPHKAMWGMHD